MKPQSKQITVVIPLYNRADCIRRTVQSILEQTLLPAEIVIVDDGSPDNSAEVVQSIGSPLIRLLRQENRGVSAARNRGIHAACTDYVAFLDADDEWLPEHVEVLDRLVRKFPQCGAIGTFYYIKDNEREPELPVLDGHFTFQGEEGILDNYYELASGAEFPIHMSALAARKDILEKLGGFPEYAEAGEDILTLAKLAAVTDIAYSKRPTTVYRMNQSERKKLRPSLKVNPLDQAFHSLLKMGAGKRGVKRFVASWYKRRMVGALMKHQWGTATRMFLVSFRTYPFQKKLFTSLLVTLYSNMTGQSLTEINRKIK